MFISYNYSKENPKGSKYALIALGIFIIFVGYIISKAFELGTLVITTKPKKALDPLTLTQLVFILFGIQIWIFGFGMIFVWFLPLIEFFAEELDKLYNFSEKLKLWLKGWR